MYGMPSGSLSGSQQLRPGISIGNMRLGMHNMKGALDMRQWFVETDSGTGKIYPPGRLVKVLTNRYDDIHRKIGERNYESYTGRDPQLLE